MIPNCVRCKHFFDPQPEKDSPLDRRAFCSAFPDGDGIPAKILNVEIGHKKPYPGDHGIQFEKSD